MGVIILKVKCDMLDFWLFDFWFGDIFYFELLPVFGVK